LKKTELKLSDFGIDELLKNGDKKLDIINNLDDYQEFLTIMNKHKISLLSNMLLLDKGKMQKFGSDSLDSRRFLVTFKD
jgi:hypothetical protein